jgi:hypothetical protein
MKILIGLVIWAIISVIVAMCFGWFVHRTQGDQEE